MLADGSRVGNPTGVVSRGSATPPRPALTRSAASASVQPVRIVVCGGTSSSGKSSVLKWLCGRLLTRGRVGFAKVDSGLTEDEALFRRAGVEATTVLSGGLCPDHALFDALPRVREWAKRAALDDLLIETAGLCGRCAPYLREAVAVCVLDCTAGIHAPSKMGPMLLDADVCVLTKADLVSQAEREVVASGVRAGSRALRVVQVNGLTGEGASALEATIDAARGPESAATGARAPLPHLYCSYCLGRTEAGVRVL